MKIEPPERTLRSRHLNKKSLVGLVILQLWSIPALTFAQEPDVLSTNIPSYVGPTMALLLFVVALNGLFVAADTGLELLRTGHVRATENGQSRRLQEMLDLRQHFIAACTLGSQTCRAWMMILSFIPAPFLTRLYANSNNVPEEWWHVLAAGVLVTIPVAALNVVFGELVPKSYAAMHPHRVVLRTQKLIRMTALILSVPSRVLTSVANFFTRRFGATASFANPNQAEEEIRSLVESAQETGEIEEEERELLHSVFEFSDTVAREVMTPRVDLDSAPVSSTPEEIIETIQKSGHSRIPIFEETDDQIIGIIHAKDLMVAQMNAAAKPVNLRTLLRPALFVPENKDLHDLLREMRVHRTQMAIVQDEFGGTAGVVTIEDIVEELIGDIVDEYDIEKTEIVPNGNGWSVEARTNIYDLNDEIKSTFSSEEFDTIGGFVFGLFGRQPKEGESFEHEGYKFVVEETDGRRILRLHIEQTRSFSDQFDEIVS